ncbi:Asp-Glu-Ala-Asp box polypeptide 21 [Jimgerdemannia flammicorona]|uniref:RNA helicase n=1 Tax=Jimgerdemannia flammicorona TaxID=994334 RepID=A0A433Q9A1_9FUNG|nr:Asp-Glu-Ala-Asp box polypeptide 21 [Jimgerdemannia flammicorona]
MPGLKRKIEEDALVKEAKETKQDKKDKKDKKRKEKVEKKASKKVSEDKSEDSSSDEPVKPKSKKHKTESAQEESEDSELAKSSKKKEKKDKKAKERKVDEEISVAPEHSKHKKTKATTATPPTPSPSASASPVPEGGASALGEEEVPAKLRLSSFRLSAATVKALESRGIKSLFPIQAETFDHIYDGNDILARARTGTGKTLAFALPMVERLRMEDNGDLGKKRGRAPRVIVLAPTRDLAKQVAGDFQGLSAGDLTVLSVYGGTPYPEQTQVLREGVDVIVGTPGRILDHINFGNLKMHSIKFVCLDEADQMLEANGFQEEMWKVLQYVQDQKKGERDYQTLLFSATVPESVKATCATFLRKEHVNVDLIGTSKNRTNENIRHIVIPSTWQSRKDIIGDVVAVYGKAGRTFIFCQTKGTWPHLFRRLTFLHSSLAEANEVGLNEKIKQDAQVLHGDIAQSSREATMKGFREGKFKCIVCTDVLARGLDIPQSDLVINCQPPKDAESYVHRSGRTGRAGRKGVCVTFYKPQEESLLRYISHKTGVHFETMAAPRPEDIIAATTEDALTSIDSVNPQVLPFFEGFAKDLIDKHGAEKALSAALACISGYSQGLPARSLLSATEGYVTLLFRLTHTIQHVGYVRNILNKQFTGLAYEDVKGMRMTKDGMGAVFDVLAAKCEVRKKADEHGEEVEEIFLAGQRWFDTGNVGLEVAKVLPELAEQPNAYGGGGGGYGGGRGYGGGYGQRNGGGYGQQGDGGRYGQQGGGGGGGGGGKYGGGRFSQNVNGGGAARGRYKGSYGRR